MVQDSFPFTLPVQLPSNWFGAGVVLMVKKGVPFTLYKNQNFKSPNHQLRAT